jgi:WD40 repeat protein
MQHPAELRKVMFSPDSRLILTVCSDGSARLWETGSCKILARPLQYGIGTGEARTMIVDGAFNFEGTAILFQYSDGSARRYSIPVPLPNDSEFVTAWAKVHCAFESDNNGLLRQLSQSEWLTAQDELRGLHFSP